MTSDRSRAGARGVPSRRPPSVLVRTAAGGSRSQSRTRRCVAPPRASRTWKSTLPCSETASHERPGSADSMSPRYGGSFSRKSGAPSRGSDSGRQRRSPSCPDGGRRRAAPSFRPRPLERARVRRHEQRIAGGVDPSPCTWIGPASLTSADQAPTTARRRPSALPTQARRAAPAGAGTQRTAPSHAAARRATLPPRARGARSASWAPDVPRAVPNDLQASPRPAVS